MSVIPTNWKSWSQQIVDAAAAEPMAVPLAIQSLIQYQVDQVLKETKQRRWLDWKREDLSEERFAVRKSKKTRLLASWPGLLAGHHAVTLRGDDWAPVYILAASVPRSKLVETSHSTSLRICNVVWQHRTSKLLALTFCNNHLDPFTTIDHFTSDSLSTNRASTWAVSRKGNGLIRACQYFATVLRSAVARQPLLAKQIGLALRVGHKAGEFMWYRKVAIDPEELVLSVLDLTPLSLREVESKPGTVLSQLVVLPGQLMIIAT